VKCPRCQVDNRDGARFCRECGATFAAVCPSCGVTAEAGSKFCDSCGAALEAAPTPAVAVVRFASPESYTPRHLAERILTSKSALEGERKQVTVLFADLKGSMELLADRDPEEARRLLDPVLERMMEAVHRYEGTVNQVMGDGIMALFGAPLAHEDHAVRACYAALRMQESVKTYAEEVQRSLGVAVKIRVGLNSGEVVVRSIGSDLRMDYTAVGQTTHLAARMEQIAAPETIVIAPATVALAEGFLQLSRLGPTSVKGMTSPVDVYELTGTSGVRSRLQAIARRGLTTFIGRTREIAQLQDALDAARRGQGQIVAVVGEAGVGKSRLFWEFTHSDAMAGCIVVEAASVSYGRATPYYPVIELLKSYFGIDTRDSVQSVRDKVTGRLLSLDRALESSVSALLSLVDSGFDDDQWKRLEPWQRREHTLNGVKRLLLRESQIQPVVAVFEDLHWIDGETQATLDALVESIPAARMLLLVNYRPEYKHEWGSRMYYRQLRADPLPSGSADTLFGALLGTDPALASLKSLLVERTEGNPLFAEEAVRALVEAKSLDGNRGAYRLTRAVTTLTVPATAQAVLAARIDRLGPDDKQRLQAAAVVGKNIPLSILQAVTGESDEELRAGIARLQAAEFLYEVRLFPDLEYTFKHALTHEVAYGTLLHERRRNLHARSAEAIERLFAARRAEHVEWIAYHAVQGELWDKATIALRDAGSKAGARSAARAAAAYFEQALHALNQLPASINRSALATDIALALHGCLMPIGEGRRLQDVLIKAEKSVSAIDDPPRRSRVLAVAAHTCWYAGLGERAVHTAEEAVRLAEEVADQSGLINATYHLGQACLSYGQLTRSADILRRVAAQTRNEVGGLRNHALRWPSINSLTFLALALAELGDLSAALRAGEEAVRLSELYDTPFGLFHACAGLGFAQLMKGDFGSALSTCLRAETVAQASDLPLLASTAQAFAGHAYLHVGNLDEAATRLERAIEYHDSTGFMAFQAMNLVYRSKAHLRSGELEKAAAAAERAAQMTVECRQDVYHAWALWMLGEVAAHPQHVRVELSEGRYREALRLASTLGMRPLVAHCHLGLGKLYRRTGQRPEAQEDLTTAVTMYREMGMTYWLEQAEAEQRA
jgi:class 3 adenylate cyclase/tetratricopeptide (TPR) repeat protein